MEMTKEFKTLDLSYFSIMEVPIDNLRRESRPDSDRVIINTEGL